MKVLAEWMRDYNGSCVVHAGAGLSTAAGIRDFRGKGGVWTELKGTSKAHDEPSTSSAGDKLRLKEEEAKVKREVKVKPFDETEPTFSHLALKELCNVGLVRHIVSQNVDGLFLKSNLARRYISELHGNFYLDECTRCRNRFVRGTASPTMRLTKSVHRCPRGESVCKGYLRDTILDWESPVPYNELRVATRESNQCSLHICIGTSMQLRPSKDLVCDPTRKSDKARDKKLVIINLQPTKLDQKANLVINYYADDVMRELINLLGAKVSSYSFSDDPTKDLSLVGTMWKK